MSTTVVVPITASFTANGTADLNQVQQESLSPFTADYDLYISNSNANDVFKAFSIAEGTADASADVIVSVVSANQTIVKAAIDYALQNALGGANAGSGAGGSTLQTLMQSYVKGEVESDLATTGLYNILEAESLLNVSISNATIGSAGSTAMWDELASQTAGNSNAMLNCIATQLPYDQYVDISNGGNLDSAFAVGDTIIFHFTINTDLDVTPQLQDVTSTIVPPAPADLTATGSAQGVFTSASKSRTFNLRITKVA